MADRQNNRNQNGHTSTSHSLLRRLHDHAPSSAQLMGFLTLAVSGGILLLLTGATVTATVLALILSAPLILITSPVWVPLALALSAAAAAFLSFCAAAVGIAWAYRYLRGLHTPGSEHVDYARSRIYDTAAQVMDYAGGGKVKDAAPGA